MKSRAARWSAAMFTLVSVFAAASAYAASDTWTGAADGNFANPGNWAGGTPPGNTSAGLTTTTDNATFNGTANTTIVVDAGRTVLRLIFDVGAAPYSFVGSTLYFNGAGTQGPLINADVGIAVNFFSDLKAGQTNRHLALSQATGGTTAQLATMFNVFGNLSAGALSTNGGNVQFTNNTRAVVRGAIADGSATARSNLLLDHTGSMVWLKGANTFTGSVGAQRGMYVFDSVTPMGGGASALGNASGTTGTIKLGSSVTREQTLYYTGLDPAGHSTDRSVEATGTSYLYIAAAGAGPLTWGGNYSSTNTTAKAFWLGAFTPQDNVFSGVINDAVASPGTTWLQKFGEGNWTLTAQNLYSGKTMLQGGGLGLDFSASGAPASDIINAASAVEFYSGTLTVTGKSGMDNSQTFNALTLREGGTSVHLAPGAGGSLAVGLGATSFARSPSVGSSPGSVLNVNPNGGTVSTAHAETTNGIMTSSGVAFATVGHADWATLSDGHIAAQTTYQTNADPTAWAAADNVSLAGNPSANVATQTINTLRMNAGSTVTIGGTDTLTIGTGGVLIAGDGTNVITGGNLAGAGGAGPRELVVIQNNTANAAIIASEIANNAAGVTHLVKAGDGTLFLTGSNNPYTGETTIAGGVLGVASTTQLGGNTLKFSGGVLGLTGEDMSFGIGTGVVNRLQWVGSGGFAAYGANRTVTINTTHTMSSTAELWLSANDSDATIYYNPTAIVLSSHGEQPSIQTIRVFDGAADIDAVISAPLNVGGGNYTGGFLKVGQGVLCLSSSSSNYDGPTLVAEGGLIVTGSAPNSMLFEVRDGAWLGGNGTISSLEIHPGAKLAPGMSLGTLSTQNRGNGYFLWNGEADDTAPGQLQFELSETDATSDRLDLGTSEFLKGAGEVFKFDFLGTSGKIGETYTLISFGTTTFTDEADFSYENLGGGNTGTFALGTGNLTFTVVPEPGTIGLAMVGLTLAALRRRMRR